MPAPGFCGWLSESGAFDFYCRVYKFAITLNPKPQNKEFLGGRGRGFRR